MSRIRDLAVILVLAFSWELSTATLVVGGEPQAGAAKKGADKQTASLDYKKLAQSLKNLNKPPPLRREVAGDGPTAAFPANFDWDEQARVLKAMKTLADNVEHCWPVLVDSLGEQDYCLTLHTDLSTEWDYNLSVGDVCRRLLVDSVTAAHMEHTPGGKQAYLYLEHPKLIPRGQKETQSWFRDRQRQGKELYELQIELCEWAIKEIPSLERTSKEAKEHSIGKIKAQIDQLSRTKKPELGRLKDFLRWDSVHALGWARPSKQGTKEQ